jgi:hypothetical protein
MVEVGQIDETLCPFRSRGILRQRGAGKQQAVVAHSEDLIGDGNEAAGYNDQQSPMPAARRNQRHDQCDAADQRQFRAHQHAESSNESQCPIEQSAHCVLRRWRRLQRGGGRSADRRWTASRW